MKEKKTWEKKDYKDLNKNSNTENVKLNTAIYKLNKYLLNSYMVFINPSYIWGERYIYGGKFSIARKANNYVDPTIIIIGDSNAYEINMSPRYTKDLIISEEDGIKLKYSYHYWGDESTPILRFDSEEAARLYISLSNEN